MIVGFARATARSYTHGSLHKKLCRIGSGLCGTSESSIFETVRKVPEVSTTQPYGLSKQLFPDHFGLRIPAKSTLRASIAPSSYSLFHGLR